MLKERLCNQKIDMMQLNRMKHRETKKKMKIGEVKNMGNGATHI